jgi:phosphopantetheinyl transferase (holo-ACP synthase)
MFHYHLYSLDQEIPSEVLLRFPYSQKAKNYYISRMALLECLDGEHLDWDKLEIEGNLKLKFFPETLVSISHTDDIGAALTARTEKYLSIGIDIEKMGRPFNEKTKKFFLNAQDDYQAQHQAAASLLEIWSFKESAFKALSPVITQFPDLFKNDRDLLLKDIWIQGPNFGLFGSKLVLGTLEKHLKVVNQQEILITLAFMSSQLPN